MRRLARKLPYCHPRESGDPAWVPAFGNVIQSRFSACRLPAPKSEGGRGLLLGFLGELVIPQQANSRLRYPFPNSRASGGDWMTSPLRGNDEIAHSGLV